MVAKPHEVKSRSVLKVILFVVTVASVAFLKEQQHLTSISGQNYVLRMATDSSAANHTSYPPFRMLLGIFSTVSDKELSKRTLISNTYLSLPKFMKRYNVTTIPLRYAGACPLEEYWYGNNTFRKNCQLVYTFVVGAAKQSDPKATPEYLDIDHDRPMTVNASKIPKYRSDTTYLNILENMNEGKSPTWFKYASSQISEDLEIDLIAKVDSDAVIYPIELVTQIQQFQREMKISYPLQGVYGGSRQRGKDKSYMQGGFYFMSRDVAQFITSDKCERERIIEEYRPDYKGERAEDVEISRFVRSFPGQVYEMEIPRGAAYAHEGKLKQPVHFRDNWKWYVATIVARDRIKRAQIQTNMTCPPPNALDEQRSTISEDLVRMLQRFDLLRSQLLRKCENHTVSS